MIRVSNRMVTGEKRDCFFHLRDESSSMPGIACQVHRTESKNLVGTSYRKIMMKSIMRICNNSMEETYGVAFVPATASSGKESPSQGGGQVMGPGAKTP